MTDTEAMNQIETCLRALFDSFTARAIATQPENADQIRATAGEVLAGAHVLIYQIEVQPIVGIKLNCGVAPGGDLSRLVRIFDGQPMAIIPQGTFPGLQ